MYSASRNFELITEALWVEVLWNSYYKCCSSDFAICASGRYHAPVIKGSAYEASYGESLRTMDEHVDGGKSKWNGEAVYKIIQTKEPNVHYKVGAFMQKFSIVYWNNSSDKV
jgi:hypothetical protein